MFVFEYLKSSDKQVFRLDEAAQIAGVHINTLRNYIDAGTLPALRTLGGHRRVTREALLQLGASMNRQA
jgi:excisionase family DNA binding protein